MQALLVIDPRHGTWALHTRPRGGAYQDALRGQYGEEVLLPEPLSLVLVTGRLPLYGPDAPTAGAPSSRSDSAASRGT